MEYELKHGNYDTTVLQQALKNGEELPDFIKNRPNLIDESLQFYLQAFFILESERQLGFSGVSSIPVTAIINYAHFLGYTDRQATHEFVNLIIGLDKVALKHYHKG